jgi:hypothetical protein
MSGMISDTISYMILYLYKVYLGVLVPEVYLGVLVLEVGQTRADSAEVIYVLNDVISGSMVQLQSPDSCAEANPRLYLCILAP